MTTDMSRHHTAPPRQRATAALSLTVALALLCCSGCSDDDQKGSSSGSSPVALPAELRYDEGTGTIGEEMDLSTPQVDHGQPLRVRKVGRRTYVRLADETRFSLPPEGWVEKITADVEALAAAGSPEPSDTPCQEELAAAVRDAADEVAIYGDRLAVEDLTWAIATIAQPDVTTARLAHAPGTCDDSQAVVDLLPAAGPSKHVTEGLMTDSGVDYQVALAGAIAVIPPPAASVVADPGATGTTGTSAP